MSVFVWIETFAGQANSGSWEAVAAGKLLADELGTELVALVFGEDAAAIGAKAGQYERLPLWKPFWTLTASQLKSKGSRPKWARSI